MARVVKLVVYLFVFVIVVGKFLPGWARETGIALRDLIFGPQHDSPAWLWTASSSPWCRRFSSDRK